MDVTALVSSKNPIALSENFKKKLVSWEDYISAFVSLEEFANSCSWLKADLLYDLFQKFGRGSLEQFAKDVHVPRSTAVNYVRVAKAFPPPTRIPYLSFSHHFVASYADPYNETSGKFEGEDRFEWLEKASDDSFSTRMLTALIQEGKVRKAEGNSTICNYCSKDEKIGEIRTYIFYSPELGNIHEAKRYRLHEKCYNSILEVIEGK